MVPAPWLRTVSVPPPSSQRGQRAHRSALHLTALTLVTTLPLLPLCALAVQLAHRRCPPPLPRGPGGAPRTDAEASLLLIALLRTLWRFSSQDMHDWLVAWPARARACGLPMGETGQYRVPSASQQCKRLVAAGAPPYEVRCILMVGEVLCRGVSRARDLSIDSAPILAWQRTDPNAAFGHAPAHHATPLLRGFRVHTLWCRGSGLPLFFIVTPAPAHDAPFARLLLAGVVQLYALQPRVVRLDAAYWGLSLIRWIHAVLGAVAVIPWNPKRKRWASAGASNGSSNGCSASSGGNVRPWWDGQRWCSAPP